MRGQLAGLVRRYPTFVRPTAQTVSVGGFRGRETRDGTYADVDLGLGEHAGENWGQEDVRRGLKRLLSCVASRETSLADFERSWGGGGVGGWVGAVRRRPVGESNGAKWEDGWCGKRIDETDQLASVDQAK